MGDLTPESRSGTNVRIAEEIINKIREAEVVMSSHSTVAETTRRIGVSEQTFSRWRAEYGDLWANQPRRLNRWGVDK